MLTIRIEFLDEQGKTTGTWQKTYDPSRQSEADVLYEAAYFEGYREKGATCPENGDGFASAA